jgi:hypothetical protein
LGNPLKHTDPSGHCPAPDPSWGAGVCFALFIAPPELTVALGDIQIARLHGDGRGFSANSDPSQSRMWVYVPTEGDIAYYSVNPSGQWQGLRPYSVPGSENVTTGWNYEPEGWIWTAPSGANQLSISRSKSGEITIEYDVVISGVPLEWGASHINGRVTFTPQGKFGYTADVDRDGFPWAEAYYHDGQGHVRTIFQDAAIGGNPHNLGAYEQFDVRTPFSLIPRELYKLIYGSPRPSQFTQCTPGQPC